MLGRIEKEEVEKEVVEVENEVVGEEDDKSISFHLFPSSPFFFSISLTGL